MKKKYLLVSIVLLAGQVSAQSLNKEKEIIIVAGPSATRLINTNIDKDEFKDIDRKAGFNFDLSYNRYFKNRIGIGVGLGFSGYNQIVSQKGLFQKPNQTDSDGNLYEKWVSSDMTYTSNLKYIDIPITLHLLLGSSEKFYGFIDAGIVNGFLIGGKYNVKGSVENMGKYYYGNPYFSDLSQGNPRYDYSKKSYDKEYTDTFRSYNVSFRASVGLAAAMTDRLFLRIAPEITKGFSDITGKDDKGKEYENALGDKSAYKLTKTFSLGLNVGFAFNM